MPADVGYLLLIDNLPSKFVDILSEAQSAAQSHIFGRKSVRIECLRVPAQSDSWYYDLDISEWVYQSNAAIGA